MIGDQTGCVERYTWPISGWRLGRGLGEKFDLADEHGMDTWNDPRTTIDVIVGTKRGNDMAFRINHIHLKAPDPGKTVAWWIKAFKFTVVSDEVRPVGDRFIRCMSEDGSMAVNISGARTGEKPGPGDASIHYGLEHFGIDSADVDADVARLVGLGAKLHEGPLSTPTGGRIAFLSGPDDVRFELVLRKA